MLPLTRSRNRSRFFGTPFSPEALFAGGTVAGAWYDPSDLTTLFTTSAGTTQCAMPGQGSAVSVGLMLDKSKGSPLAVGAHRYWRYIVGVSTNQHHPRVSRIVLSTATASTDIVVFLADNCADQGTIPTLGATYAYDFGSATAIVSASVYATFNGSRAALYQVEYSDDNTNWFSAFQGNMSATTCGLFAGSVFAYNGNHAIAFNNTTARPELRARVNLLTYSEQFDNAAWVKGNVTVTANAATAPDGTTTADLVYPSTSGTDRYVWQQVTGLTTGATFKTSIRLKNSGINFAYIYNVRGNQFFYVNLTTGATSNVGTNISNLTSSVDANGWVTVTFESVLIDAQTTAYIFVGASDAAGSTSVTASGTNGILVWGADLRPANIGANVPAYQRIADANTYDTSGFPLYLRFDGIDDSMYTPASINFSGTDKMSVFAGVRALQSAVLVISELSANTNSNNGSFVLYKNNDGLGFASKGTSLADVNNGSGSVPPISLVLTGQSDISAPSISLRSNGTQILSSVSSQGAGNFGTYPLYIGSRGNASNWFNGQVYGLLVVGSAVSAGNISATEQWVAGKTGIQI